MENKGSLLFEKVFSLFLLILAGLSILVVVYTILSRISYPYSLERMEGVSLLQVMRILSGQALYVQPSLEYVPLIYPPVYFYLSALITRLLGVGFAPLRLVSALAFVGCLIVIFQMIKTTTSDRTAAVIGASFFAATYPLSGVWFDIARVDTLFVFFCVLGIYFSIRDTTLDLFLSTLFWLLAIFTKQSGIIALAASFAFLLLHDFRRNIIRLALTILSGGLIYGMSLLLWGKWFTYFCYYLPTFHKPQNTIAEISVSLYQLVLPPIIALVIGMLPFLLDKNWWSKGRPIRYYGFMTCFMFGLALAGRLNLGGFTNVYMPAHVMTAVMLGLGLNWWRNRGQTKTSRSSSLALLVVYLLSMSQFLSLYFDPRSVIPNSAYQQSWARMEALMQSVDGDILAPELNYLTVFAGKKAFANQVALEEIFGEFGNAEPVQRNLLSQEINRALQEKHFKLLLLKDTDELWKDATKYYRCSAFSEQADSKGFPSAVVRDYQLCVPKDQPLE